MKTFSTSEGPSVRDLGWRPLSPQDPGPCTRKRWETGGSISCHSGCVPEAACILLAAQLWPVTLRLCLSVTLMSEWQEGLPSLIMIHTLKLKQLESSTDVSTMRSDVLLQHVTSESRENRDSLRGKGLPGGHLPVTRQRHFCLFPRIPPPHTPPALCSAITCSVKPDGVPQLCRTDEIGELCVCAIATGTSYYGLSGMTKNTFEVGRGGTHGQGHGTE